MKAKEEEPVDFSNPTKLAGQHIAKDLPHLKRGWKGAVGIAILSFLAGFGLAWYLVVASKNATIEDLNTRTETLKTRADNLQKDYEALFKENTQLKAVNSELTSPLKTRLAILIQQLREFPQQHVNNNNGIEFMRAREEFNNRFEMRIPKAVSQLDEEGQHSDLLNNVNAIFYDMGDIHFTNAMKVANELERLTKNLK